MTKLPWTTYSQVLVVLVQHYVVQESAVKSMVAEESVAY